MPKLNSFSCHYFGLLLLLLAIEASPATTSRLLILKNAETLPFVHAICDKNISRYALEAKRLGLHSDCHMPSNCKHIYLGGAVSGFSGTFSHSELDLLINTCLPTALLYHEEDATVVKAEDQPKFSPASEDLQQPFPPRKKLFLTSRRSLRQALPGSDFEQNSALDGNPIDLKLISQGQDINLPAEKQQTLEQPLWNLDRLDQKSLPLDKKYSFGSPQSPGLGQGVTIYVLDTGIMSTHQEFQTWTGSDSNNSNTKIATSTTNAAPILSRASCGYDFIENSTNCEDIDGDGSHVAGTAIGLQVGVAKGASVIAVKILDAQGLGTLGSTIAGLDYVASNHKTPAVVTLSLGVQRGQYSRAMEDAVRALVEDYGVTVFAAAGNAAGDSCQFSPGATPQAFTVSASDFTGKYNSNDVNNNNNNSSNNNSSSNMIKSVGNEHDGVYIDGNQGSCVDLFAPGVDIYSVCGGIRRCGHVSNSTYAYASGTSMAVPHVAGAAAIFLETHPEATPAEVSDALKGAAVIGAIDPTVLKTGTTNTLLQVRGLSDTRPAAVQAAEGPTGPNNGK